jgi:hypothetical protein
MLGARPEGTHHEKGYAAIMRSIHRGQQTIVHSSSKEFSPRRNEVRRQRQENQATLVFSLPVTTGVPLVLKRPDSGPRLEAHPQVNCLADFPRPRGPSSRRAASHARRPADLLSQEPELPSPHLCDITRSSVQLAGAEPRKHQSRLCGDGVPSSRPAAVINGGGCDRRRAAP